MRHFLTLKDLSPQELDFLIDKGIEIKKNPEKFSSILTQKTMLMIFAKPSLRTRVSFETLMTQSGGHGIYYDVSTSPMGKKESISDTAKTASRMVDIIMARLFEHSDIEELADNSSVPVINALTNFSHPCQIVGDLMTVREQGKNFKGLKFAYVGDSNNNVTHSIMFGGALAGMDIWIASPKGERFAPQPQVITDAEMIAVKTGGSINLTSSAEEAVENADVVYTDSWMSYHIKDIEKNERLQIFDPYRITTDMMKLAKNDVMFLHCLPAQRGVEVTAEVIDGPRSFVFDEAENRLHIQKAIIYWCLGLI